MKKLFILIFFFLTSKEILGWAQCKPVGAGNSSEVNKVESGWQAWQLVNDATCGIPRAQASDLDCICRERA